MRKLKINSNKGIAIPDHVTILKAIHFAANKHKNQRRKDINASPYINHPIAVALTIAESGGNNNPAVITAAILHDTLEDTNTTPLELENLFGKKVRTIVQEVSDNKLLKKNTRKKMELEHAKHISPEACLVKIADKICNIRDITNSPPAHWDSKRKKEYLEWATAMVSNCACDNVGLKKEFEKTVGKGRRRLEKE